MNSQTLGVSSINIMATRTTRSSEHIEGMHHIGPRSEQQHESINNEYEKSTTIQLAQDAVEEVHALTVWQAVNLYPKAILYSCGLCLCIIMEGYDTSIQGSFFGLPQFRKRFGQKLDNGDYQFTALQQSLFSVGSVGSVIGLFFVGWLIEKIGYRNSMLFGLAFMSATICLTFFAQNYAMLLAGQIVCNIPWGMFQGMASAYATDLAPAPLKVILTSYINLCWIAGQFLSTGVLTAMLDRQDQWAYRIPFGIQWVWPIPIALIVLLAPESPWWLIRKGRISDARATLKKISSKEVTTDQIDRSLNLIIATDAHEQCLSAGTSYYHLFTRANFRRTEVSAGAWICQVTCGIWFSSNIVYFMEQAGFSPVKSFYFGLGMNGISFLATICSWFITTKVGRRTIYIQGLAAMLVTEILVGLIYIPTNPSAPTAWAAGALLIVNTLAYQISVGPVCYTIVPEAPSARLRAKTVAFSRAMYNVAALGAGFLNTPILNPTGWDLKGKGGFVWGAFCFISLVWAYFRLPEFKDRTEAEIDMLFEKRISPKHFAEQTIDAFNYSD